MARAATSKRNTKRARPAKASRKSSTKSAAKSSAKSAKSSAKARNAPKRAAARNAAKRLAARKAPRPIDVYYWPTPNGFKITIMLEECRLPYNIVPINISKGDQFDPAFLAISPNNRMPAIVDPDGPGGKPIAMFESGAILQYLGRKTGKFYPADERGRVEVEQWLFWQMAGLGPMAGQCHHFRNYAKEQIPYAINRYVDECNRLYGVMNKRLADREFLAGRYSIADMACVGWANGWQRQGQDIEDFPHLKRWLATMKARPAVERGLTARLDLRQGIDMKDPNVQSVLFGQRAR